MPRTAFDISVFFWPLEEVRAADDHFCVNDLRIWVMQHLVSRHRVIPKSDSLLRGEEINPSCCLRCKKITNQLGYGLSSLFDAMPSPALAFNKAGAATHSTKLFWNRNVR